MSKDKGAEMQMLELENKELTRDLKDKDNEIDDLSSRLEDAEEEMRRQEYGSREFAVENEELKRKMRKKEKQIETLEHRLTMVKEQNSAMQLRDAEWTHQQIKDYVGMRSTIIVESSLFADFTHTSDPFLQETAVSVLDSSNFETLSVATVDWHKGTFSRSTLHSLKNGTPILLKKYLMWEGKDADVKNLQFLSHESRLLSFLGLHTNIVQQYGIVFLGGAFHIALKYEGELSLLKFLEGEIFDTEAVVRSIIEGLAEAVAFLHEKDVLHNHITSGNAMLSRFGDGYRPVLIGFAFASRRSVTKILSKETISRFKENNHLAPEIVARKQPPSFHSDVYSYGVILRRILARRLPLAEYPISKLKRMMEKCTRFSPQERPLPNILRRDIISAFYDMYAAE